MVYLVAVVAVVVVLGIAVLEQSSLEFGLTAQRGKERR